MRWDRINKMLDKEVQRETKRILAKAKAAMGLSNGHSNGVVTARKVNKALASSRRAIKRAYHAESPIHKRLLNARVLHGRYLGLTRNLPPAQKKAIREIRAEKGVRAAIAAAKNVRTANA